MTRTGQKDTGGTRPPATRITPEVFCKHHRIRPRKQIIQEREICVLHVFWHFRQQKLHVFIWFEIVCFRGFHDAVNDCARLRAFYRVDHMPVGAPDAERANRSLAGGIVDGNSTVNEKDLKILFLIDAVL